MKLLLWFGLFATFGVPRVLAAPTPAVLERFEGTAPGKWGKDWKPTTAGGTVRLEDTLAANRIVVLQRTKSEGNLSLARSFAPLRGRVVVEARVKSSDTNGFKSAPSVSSSNGQQAVAIGFDGANIVCHDGQERRVVQPFSANEWYVVRLEIDTVAGLYSLYVDGIKKVENARLSAPVADIARVSFGVENGANNDCAFDNLRVYSHAAQIGAPPAPVFDVTKYGALGDGTTDNTRAIQKAIDACAGTGGSVLLPAGTFLSGTLTLKSDMTLFVDAAATLKGIKNDDAYPRQEIADFPNAAVEGLRKAFLFAQGAKNLRIDGGGTIDGSGDFPQWRMNGGESKRPFLLFPVRCQNLSIQNVYLKDSAVWCFVPTECQGVQIHNICIDSRDYGNRDGIDVVDSKNVLIEDCTFNTDDDSICPKSGVRSGVQNLTVRNCNLMGSVRANGIKFGTLSYGQLKNALFEDLLIKNCDKGAISLEAVDGADIENVRCRRIDISNTSSPMYLIIGTRGHTPQGDTPKIGSIRNVLFEDVAANNLKTNIGCPLSGNRVEGKRYPLENITFRRCNLTFKGGQTTLPKFPPEMGQQYPECNLWGPLPAYGFFLRHADNVVFEKCHIAVAGNDIRPQIVASDANYSRK